MYTNNYLRGAQGTGLINLTEDYTYHKLLADLQQNPLNEHGAKVLADTVEQLRWVQAIPATSGGLDKRHPLTYMGALPATAKVACPGVIGAYTHMACEKLFPQGDVTFFDEFTDVVDCVLSGKVDYGVLPVENSSAGQVTEVLKMVLGNDLYICKTTEIKIEHCLCIHPESDPDAIATAVSHPQALAQCQQYLRDKGLAPQRYSNTATAAQMIGEAPGTSACVCSVRSAGLYGLKILERNIQDFDENYTRFICISTKNILLPGADTVSIALSVPHEPGYLNKLLTRFAACDLDLSRLLSMPIASREFSVLFFLDFQGNVEDARVENLLDALLGEVSFFKFIGNHSRLP